MSTAEILSEYNIDCDQYREKLLDSYMEKLLAWNESINLTAITERDDFIVKHYADSLSIISTEEYGAADKIIDVGTGGGFPGVPLAIFSSEKRFTLLDSLAKRLNVIDSIATELSIKNIDIIHERAEDAGRDPKFREGFDLCVSRAVSDLSTLSEYCIPFVKEEGYFISYKGADVSEELKNAERAIDVLGGEISKIERTNTGHSLVIIKKLRKTPTTYPRRAGVPGRTPIR